MTIMRRSRQLRMGVCAVMGAALGTFAGFCVSMPATAYAAQATTAAEAAAGITAPTENVVVSSCVITETKDTVRYTGYNYGAVSGADNRFYMFEIQPYQDGISGRTDYVAAINKAENVVFEVPLNYGRGDNRLYSSFVIAVFDGEKYVPVSEPSYITNPQIIAPHQNEYQDPLTKKGLLIENAYLEDAFDLGVKHVIVNIPFHHILGQGIDYEYDGKMYHFDKALMEKYDNTISRMSEKGMLVTATILNGWNDNTPQLVYPGVKKRADANYYAFNASTQEGYEDIKAIASFLAERYSGTDPNHGKVSNWIIGNEINNNKNWNYIGPMDLGPYVKEYVRAFRVFYTAIRSVNANDRLFFSLDYHWNDPNTSQLNYKGKDIVDTFNNFVRANGQMDWGLAYHPYPVPMVEPEFWDDDPTLVYNDISSPIINFKNLSVLTDYFQRNELLMPNGHVRHIILSEQGFTSMSASRGEDTYMQAAAFAYAYYIADSNPYIDAFILSRQIDAVSETELSQAFGLWKCDMSSPGVVIATQRKKIWEVFRSIDKAKYSLEVSEFAKPLIGINKWSDVIPNFKYRAKEN